ncbi:MAG: protein kinase [Thermoanaerobaculia bacterium]
MRAEVESLLMASSDAGSFLEEPALQLVTPQPAPSEQAETPNATRRIGAWTLLQEIGRGGMGTVFLAERTDRDFAMKVALKVINRGMDTDTIVRRFRTERRILAGLEHPGIARLIDGGTTDDGLPFFVLEYVEGMPIDAWCDVRRLGVRARLELFRKVCAAVAFAHQSLVVHRDLKPGNILVTEEGEPKLLDFGLATFLGPDPRESRDQTVSADKLLTPRYASPEQVRGERITTATDVYSLGVLLYELLSGRRPYDAADDSSEELVHVVCDQEPGRPSAETLRPMEGPATGDDLAARRETSRRGLARQLKGDLDTIVLKALRKDPARRYASVERLSEDIRRHLDGRPVTARADSFWYRNGKFLRRNRFAVTAVGLLGMALLAGSATTAWQARLANSQRARAERRFDDVRKLARTLMYDLHDEIAKVPGSTKARALLVANALEYLDGLAREAGDDQSLRRELASAYERVGDVEGRLNDSNLGNSRAAHASYAKALAIRQDLVRGNPGRPEILRELAISWTKSGDILWVEGKPAEAARCLSAALSIEETLATARSSPEVRLRVAAGFSRLGYMQGASGQLKESLGSCQKALGMLGQLEREQPGDVAVLTETASTHLRLGQIQDLLAHDSANALEQFREALAIDEGVAVADPSSLKYKRRLLADHFNIAESLEKSGNISAAIASQRRAMQLAEVLTAADPADAEARGLLATVAGRVGNLLVSAGKPASAIGVLDRALRISDSLSAADPANQQTRARTAVVHAGLGRAHAHLGNDTGLPSDRRIAEWREARSWFRHAREVWLDLREKGSTAGDEDTWPEKLASEIGRCDRALQDLGAPPRT